MPVYVFILRSNLWVDFSLRFFFPREKAQKDPPEDPLEDSLGSLFRQSPLGFPQKPFIEGFEANRTRKFGKIFVTQVPCGTFFVPDLRAFVRSRSPWALWRVVPLGW